MLLDFEDEVPARAEENCGLHALSLEATDAFIRGNNALAARLLAAKLALRALVIEPCQCANSKVCLKCHLVVDEGDLGALLNFFALKLLDFRLKLYKERPQSPPEKVNFKVERTFIALYRTLIRLTFHAFTRESSLASFVDKLWQEAHGVSLPHSAESSDFFADADYQLALKRIFTTAMAFGAFSDRSSVVSLLRGGRQLAQVNEAKFKEGECFLYSQAVLYRLLFAHDRNQRVLFVGPMKRLLLS